MALALTPTTAALLETEGLLECVPALLAAGLTRIDDIVNNKVKEADLQVVGIQKLFHQRKLVRLSMERIEQRRQQQEQAMRKSPAQQLRMRSPMVQPMGRNGTPQQHIADSPTMPYPPLRTTPNQNGPSPQRPIFDNSSSSNHPPLHMHRRTTSEGTSASSHKAAPGPELLNGTNMFGYTNGNMSFSTSSAPQNQSHLNMSSMIPATPSIRERILRRQREQQLGQRRPQEGGDHILIHVIAAKSAPDSTYPLGADKSYKVRVGLSDFFDGLVVEKKGTSITTPAAKGPSPLFLFDTPETDGGDGLDVSASDRLGESTSTNTAAKHNSSSGGGGGGVFTRAGPAPKSTTTAHAQPSLLGVTTYGDGSDPTCIKVRTNFMQHCLTFELLESRSLLSDKVVGATVFPISFFHTFNSSTIIDSWFPIRRINKGSNVLETALAGLADGSQAPFSGAAVTPQAAASPIIGAIRLVLEVPGGCPKQFGKAFHINAINMSNRFLMLEVFDAILFQNTGLANKFAQKVTDLASLPSTPARLDDSIPDRRQHQQKISITLATEPLKDVYLSIRINDQDEGSRRWSNVVEGPTYRPKFDTFFTWTDEVASSKCVTLLLKRKKGFFSKPAVVAAAHIPLQFFLSQNQANTEEKMVMMVDQHNPLLLRAAIHVRLTVAPSQRINAPRPPPRMSIEAINNGTQLPWQQVSQLRGNSRGSSQPLTPPRGGFRPIQLTSLGVGIVDTLDGGGSSLGGRRPSDGTAAAISGSQPYDSIGIEPQAVAVRGSPWVRPNLEAWHLPNGSGVLRVPSMPRLSQTEGDDDAIAELGVKTPERSAGNVGATISANTFTYTQNQNPTTTDSSPLPLSQQGSGISSLSGSSAGNLLTYNVSAATDTRRPSLRRDSIGMGSPESLDLSPKGTVANPRHHSPVVEEFDFSPSSSPYSSPTPAMRAAVDTSLTSQIEHLEGFDDSEIDDSLPSGGGASTVQPPTAARGQIGLLINNGALPAPTAGRADLGGTSALLPNGKRPTMISTLAQAAALMFDSPPRADSIGGSNGSPYSQMGSSSPADDSAMFQEL